MIGQRSFRKASRGLCRSFGTAVGAAVAAYFLILRPWHLRWGATDEETTRPLRGDELVSAPDLQATRAITIRVPAAQVWPWLVQMGYGRAGWYSYDRLEAAVGAGEFLEGRSADRIIPKLQRLAVGDPMPVAPDLGWFVVAALEPERALVLRGTIDLFSGRAIDPADRSPESYFDGSWALVLEPLGDGSTRLLARFRGRLPAGLPAQLGRYLLLEPGHFLMEQKMLRGIRERAERLPGADQSSRASTP